MKTRPISCTTAYVNSAARDAFKDAVSRKARLQVGRTQHAPRTLLALCRDRLHVVDQLALVPHVVAGGQHIRAQFEKLIGNLRRDSEAAGGVLAIDDYAGRPGAR